MKAYNCGLCQQKIYDEATDHSEDCSIPDENMYEPTDIEMSDWLSKMENPEN